MKPPCWFVYSLIVLSVLMAGAVFGAWNMGPTQPGDWMPARWLKISGYALGALLFAAWACVLVVAGLFRLDAGPARRDAAALRRGTLLVILTPLAVLLFIVYRLTR